MRTNILSLNYKEAQDFFFRLKSYINFDLPQYFNFKKVLDVVAGTIEPLAKEDLVRAKDLEKINHIIYSNKDGKYAWRKFEIINPILYVSLVKIITNKNIWPKIVSMMKLADNNVGCFSMPVVGEDDANINKLQVEEWLEEVEKESIRLALDYEYIYQTDIVDCYGSIYTHSIPWALHGKKLAKRNRSYDGLLGNKIDLHIQAMSYGQTNGIPQGSVLMDFIAEIVLNFADRNILKKISILKLNNYKIIRYRDDYRVFVSSPEVGEAIMKILGETLIELGMSLHATKTKKSDSIISESIKKDKMSSLEIIYKPIHSQNDLRDELLRIYALSKEFPNSGSISKRLSSVSEGLSQIRKIENHMEIISITINIGCENPKVFPLCMRMISKIFEKIINLEEKNRIIEKIFRKIELLPNNGFFELWLQRIFVKDNSLLKKYNSKFNDSLCKVVNNSKVTLFDNSWYLKNDFESVKYINQPVLNKTKNIIEKKEISAHDWYMSR